MSANCDAFTPPKQMLPFAEATAALQAAVRPVEAVESVPLFEAVGRVLAGGLSALRTVPPADNSAVDGYAVRAIDLVAPEVRLPIGGRIAAGQVLGRSVRPGEALRIFTGAPIPDGADTAIPQENCRLDGDSVWLPQVERGANVRPAGEDFLSGDIILPAGKRLLPQDVGHAAAAGYAELSVRRRPRIAFFATGDEVREPGQPAEPGTIVNCNAFVLHGLLQRLGCEPLYMGIIRDREVLLRDALAKAAADGVDAIMTTGGVSMGEEDHVKAAVEALGALNFWRIAIRPGKPLAFGRVGSVPFIGLPGNPVSAMVTFLMLARPLLQTIAGVVSQAIEGYPVRADFSFDKKVGRREWLRGSLYRGADGGVWTRRFPNEGSGVFTSMVASSGLIELPEDLEGVAHGDTVSFLPFSELLGG
ncbi:gephyrin-like molybdotransferase Glp [Telmatospirillum sp.]|uniref:molybdopterin molybdotransferase MoeA n=1 Tax=Telmatospirillum sp. TaxID=2079197 RepID=UPI00283B3A21|nr:gephyrin-like molybdotransferase Glp [Telmatospirillum sp.]MDR3437059.1 molybdopterin molybdotransferase MoeA [Telmatospirillum sp.]